MAAYITCGLKAVNKLIRLGLAKDGRVPLHGAEDAGRLRLRAIWQRLARLQSDDSWLVLGRVQRERSEHGVQSFRANRASKTMPFSGQVFGSHEMLCLPAGQVTTCRSQSTWN
jgi:hypothetical protein